MNCFHLVARQGTPHCIAFLYLSEASKEQRSREEAPGLFEGTQGFEVYAQPAAVVDGIIQGWQLQALSMKFPGADFCRDNGQILMIVGEISKKQSKKPLEIVFPRAGTEVKMISHLGFS